MWWTKCTLHRGVCRAALRRQGRGTQRLRIVWLMLEVVLHLHAANSKYDLPMGNGGNSRARKLGEKSNHRLIHGQKLSVDYHFLHVLCVSLIASLCFLYTHLFHRLLTRISNTNTSSCTPWVNIHSRKTPPAVLHNFSIPQPDTIIPTVERHGRIFRCPRLAEHMKLGYLTIIQLFPTSHSHQIPNSRHHTMPKHPTAPTTTTAHSPPSTEPPIQHPET